MQLTRFEEARFQIAERQRLRAHFARVVAELESRDVHGWSPARRRSRARSLALVRAYAARGRFPRNETPGKLRPVFVDRAGTHCAVAFMASALGQDNLVRRVCYLDNHLDLHGGPNLLAAWLSETGLDPEEAAAIQPSYPCPDGTSSMGCFGHSPITSAPPPAVHEPVSFLFWAVMGALMVLPLSGLFLWAAERRTWFAEWPQSRVLGATLAAAAVLALAAAALVKASA